MRPILIGFPDTFSSSLVVTTTPSGRRSRGRLCAFSDDRRKRRRYLAFLDRFTIHSSIEQAPGPVAHSGDRLGELLKLKLSTLERLDRSLIEQKYFEHMSVKSIACLLYTSPSPRD